MSMMKWVIGAIKNHPVGCILMENQYPKGKINGGGWTAG